MNRLMINQHKRAAKDIKLILILLAVLGVFTVLNGDVSIKEALITFCIGIPLNFMLSVVLRSFVAWSFRYIRKRSDYREFITKAHNSRKR